ncbi:MAG TPA: glycoside hydrolase family 15 protein, partial [Thermoplasmata archaeon]|nr:glycoside hydrolase family 15 protein [Thermoplasmata archaeon]
QERWEELSGFSPSTLATNVAGLVVAAGFARAAGEVDAAVFMEEYADFLNSQIEGWTVTTQGTAYPPVPEHYIRIRPVDPADSYVEGPANSGSVRIANHPEADPALFPAKEVVDAGFLELVRYGLRKSDDPLVARSVEVVDHVLKVSTPVGPCWRRYNHDGYGQRDDGGPFVTWGTGRAWPLLVGERAHYELARGREVAPLVKAMEQLASSTGLIPEQVWDGEDRPYLHLGLGKPTTSAMPLVWAHAEYLKLLRSIEDGRVFDRIPEVEARYSPVASMRSRIEIWKPHHRTTQISAGTQLRIQAPEPFRLHWSLDSWTTVEDTDSVPTSLGIHYVDLPTQDRGGRLLVFTFFWIAREGWEGQDYSVRINEPRETRLREPALRVPSVGSGSSA